MKTSISQIKNSVKNLAKRVEQDQNRLAWMEDKVEELDQSMTMKKY
jgi:hypothetical protein